MAAIVVFFGLIGTINTTDGSKETQPPVLSDEDQIKARIETFLTAYNTGDMDKVLECLDAKTRNAFEAWLNILGAVAGKYTGIDIDLSDLFSLGVNTTKGDFMGLTINSINIIDTKNAVVNTTMTLSGQTMTIYFKMLRENGGWYINDMTDKNIDTSQPSTKDGFSMYWGLDYVDGVAIAYYYENNILCKCILNPNGEVIYRTKDGSDLITIGGGSVIALGYNEKTMKCDIPKYIVDSNGNVSNLDANEMKFIVGGDGMALLYQQKESIYGVEYLYGVVNSSGDWVQNLTDFGVEPIYNGFDSKVYYLGDDVFVINESIFWNVKTGTTFSITYLEKQLPEFIDGATFVYGAHALSRICSPYDKSNTPADGVKAPEYYVLYSDGAYRAYDMTDKRIKGYSNGYIWYTKTNDSENIYIENIFTSKIITVGQYPIENIISVAFNDDFGMIVVAGQGGKGYVALIDELGNQLLESFEIYYSGFSGEYTLNCSGGVVTFKNPDQKWCILGEDGSIIETDYCDIGDFENDRATACIGENSWDLDAVWVYIDKTGEPVMDTIPKQ